MATFQIGDTVKFLDEVGGGKITKIIDSKTVMVETPDGFEFPYDVSKLILVKKERNYQETQSQQQETQPPPRSFLDDQEPDIIKDNEQTKIYLAIVPRNHVHLQQSDFELHLINDSNWHLLYVYQIPHQDDDKVKSTPGHLQPNMIEELSVISAKELSQIREITFHVIFFRRTPHQPKKPLIAKVRLKPEKLFASESYIENDYIETPSLLYPILEEHPLEQALQKLQQQDFKQIKHTKEVKNQQLNKPRQFRSGKKPDTWEIDLHITELLDDTRGMSPQDMLNYQMQVFKDKLEQGLQDPHVKKIIFIHGRGNGRLRQEIRNYLERKKIPYQDASFAKYGFGATMVFV